MVCRSWNALLLPKRANGPQFPIHGARDTTELGGDLLVGVAFHFPDGYRTQFRIIQAIQQPLTFLGHLYGELRGRFATEDLFELGLRFEYLPATPFLAALIPEQMGCLSRSKDDQEPP